MSFLVKRIEVKGFQRTRTVVISLHPDVNFIIGRNGTGKTTFIRILSSVLSLDVAELSRLPFSSVVVTFSNTENELSPSIKIERIPERRGALAVSYRAHGNAAYVEYLIDDEDEPYPFRFSYQPTVKKPHTGKDSQEQPLLSALRKELKSNLQFSWLPLLRSRSANRRNEVYLPEYTEEPINRKLKELLTQTSNYLSVLDSQVADVTRNFQRDVFVSYLEKNRFSTHSLVSLDLKDEQKHITSMFVEMGYPTTDLDTKVEDYFSRARNTKEKVSKSDNQLTFDDIVNIISASALHRIVNAYQIFTEAKRHIMQPKIEFLDIVNDMLYRKTVHFDTGNLLNVEETDSQSRPGRKLDVYDMSSGEKQLLVILSQALLQQHRSYVFVADEPELSLHVDWQVRLVQIIRNMNQRAQIIFATHSPDIVSVYQDRVFDFEKI